MEILRTSFSIINLYDSLSDVFIFQYEDMLFEAILTLKGQKPLGTRLMYSPPTSVSTAIFSDYRRSNKTSQYIFIQLKRIKGKTLR